MAIRCNLSIVFLNKPVYKYERRKTVKKRLFLLGMTIALSASICGCEESTNESVNPTDVAEEEIPGPYAEDDYIENIEDAEDEYAEGPEDDEINAPEIDEDEEDYSAGPSADKSLLTAVNNAEDAPDDVKKQVQLIADSYDIWIMPDTEEYYYTVTDLDHDGKLEIIDASMEGTGLYTYLKLWEVNDSNDGLTQCDISNPEDHGSLDVPDLIENGGFVTYVNGSEYIYVASDFVHVDSDISMEAIRSFKLNGSTLEIDTLARKENKGDRTEFYDGNSHKTITEEAFTNIADTKYGSSYTKSETKFLWDDLSSDDWYEKLLNCYVSFAEQ